MLIHVISSMLALLATSGCMDLSGPLFAGAAQAIPASPPPLPAVADKLVGTWVAVSPSPRGEKREFTFVGRRYDGIWASKAALMFGFAAPWDTALDGNSSGNGFWGESPDRAGEFVVYARMSGIV